MRFVGRPPDTSLVGPRRGGLGGLRIRKDLLGPAEKASIIAAIKSGKYPSAMELAHKFKRLPATILKFAAEAGVGLR